MKNTLSDLNNYLFEQIERLQDDSLSDEQFEKEVERSKSITNVAKAIIENGSLAFQARKHMDEYGAGASVEIPLLGITNK